MAAPMETTSITSEMPGAGQPIAPDSAPILAAALASAPSTGLVGLSNGPPGQQPQQTRRKQQESRAKIEEANSLAGLTPVELAKHVTIWNRHECRKIAGNAAPLRRNLARYLRKHPECEEYTGQDKDPNRAKAGSIDPITGERIGPQNEHVPIWHKVEQRKITGNAAPLKKNLQSYLRKHPYCEVYDGQDKRPPPVVVVQDVPHQNTGSRFIPAASHQGSVSSNTSTTVGSGGSCPESIIQGTSRIWQTQPMTGQKRTVPDAPLGQSVRHSHGADGGSVHHRCNRLDNFCQSCTKSGVPLSKEPTYEDIVSSWSNLPNWGTMAWGIPGAGASSSARQAQNANEDSRMNDTESIPIPGDRHPRADVVMGSIGHSLGGSSHIHADIANFFVPSRGATPQSAGLADAMMDFSPSDFFAASPQRHLAYQIRSRQSS